MYSLLSIINIYYEMFGLYAYENSWEPHDYEKHDEKE